LQVFLMVNALYGFAHLIQLMLQVSQPNLRLD